MRIKQLMDKRSPAPLRRLFIHKPLYSFFFFAQTKNQKSPLLKLRDEHKAEAKTAVAVVQVAWATKSRTAALCVAAPRPTARDAART